MKVHLKNAIWPAMLVTAILLAITSFYFFKEEKEFEEKREEVFTAAADKISDTIRQRLLSYELILRGVKGFYEGSDVVSRAEYRTYIRTLEIENKRPGLQAIAIVQHIALSDEQAHLENMRKNYYKEYTIRPAGQRSQYAPIVLIEPYSNTNMKAIGFDFSTNSDVKPALDHARDLNELAMTGKTMLIQDADKRIIPAATIMYVPIYAKDATIATQIERRKAIVGWVSGPIRISDLIAELSNQIDADIGLDIYVGEVAKQAHLYGSRSISDQTQLSALRATRNINIGGKRWVLVMSTLPSFEERFGAYSHHWAIGSVGVFLSLALGWLVWLLSTGRERAVILAKRMTNSLHATQAELEATLNAIPDILFELGLDGRYYKVRTSTANSLIAPAETLLGKRVTDFFPPQASATCLASLQEANEQGFSYGKQIQIPIRNEMRWFELSVSRLEESSEDNPRFIMISHDITERVKSEHELRIAATAFESQEAMYVTNQNQRILKVNAAFTDITGYSSEEVIGKTPEMLKSGLGDDETYQKMCATLESKHFWQGEIWNKRKDGTDYPERLSITAVLNDSGEVTNYIGLFSDISNIKQAEYKIHSLAFYDSLTGLPNRQLLMEHLRKIVSSSVSKRYFGAILFVNLDNFKSLNDTKGHDIGDKLLIEVAKRIINCLQASNILARQGSDEFVVVLEALSNKEGEAIRKSREIAEKIRDAIRVPFDLSGYEYHGSSCIGISLFHGDETTTEELLMHADAALYQAKLLGRNEINFFDNAIRVALEDRVLLESSLRKALPQQLELYYQIQVDHHGKSIGAEALIRWIHPEKGVISPASFIPLAEESGLILPIGLWVLTTACRQLKAWESDPKTRHLVLAVNVSAKQLLYSNFVDELIDVLDQTGVDPSKLKIELTESMLVEDVDSIIYTMNTLLAKGVSFSLDDFGTGFSSLSIIKRLPLSQLKVDQSFVSNLLTDANDAAIVRTVIALGQSLGLMVIAEGVETEEQKRFLAISGCFNYQGFLFGKPVPVADFEKLLATL